MKYFLIALAFFSTAAWSAGISVPENRHREEAEQSIRYYKDKPFYVREVDVGASSWSPHGFDSPSRLEKKSGFSRTGVPSFHGYAVFSALSDHGFWTWLAPEVGLTATQIERSGRMNYFGTEQDFTQKAHVIGASFGVRVEAPYFDDKFFSVWQSLGVMPSLIFVSKSVFNEGEIAHALPLYGRLGFRVGPLSWAVQILAGVEATTASIAEQNIEGVGVFAGAQFRF